MGLLFVITLILFILGTVWEVVSIGQCILGLVLIAVAWWLYCNKFWRFW